MRERIKRYIAKSVIVKVYADVEGEEDCYFGIPIKLSRSLLVLHEISDFHFDGFRTVRLKYIVKIRRRKCEVTQKKIMEMTGEIKNHVIPSWLRVGSWKSLLTSLKNKGMCVCVESGLIKVNVFAIGEIYALKDNAVILKSFDVHGKWCKPKHRIRYSDITEVLFGDEYSVTFNEFVKNSQPSPRV